MALLIPAILAALPVAGVRALPAAEWTPVHQTPLPAAMHPGEKLVVTVVVRNDGPRTWRADAPGEAAPARLAAVAPRGRSSAFASADPTWLWSAGTRIRMVTPVVGPGEHATFAFTFTAPVLPSYPVTYVERFAPVIEGVAWLDDADISFTTTVRPLVAAVPSLPNPELPAPPSSCAVSADRAGNAQALLPPAAAAGYRFGSPLSASFAAPASIAADPVGRFVVADAGSDRISRIDETGFVLFSWGATGSGTGQLRGPSGVAVSPTGQVFVADTGNDRIQVFSLAGGYINQFGGAGMLRSPRGLAIGADGLLYVADTGNARIAVFRTDGAFVRSIGDGLLLAPLAVSVFGTETFVADGVVRVFDADGMPRGIIGGDGDGDGCMRSPGGVVANAYGVFVADTGHDRLQHFTRTGALIEQWGTRGSAAGQMRAPAGLTMNASTLFVAEAGGGRIQRFNARASVAR